MNIKITSDNDIDFSSNNLELLEGIDEISQKLRIRLKFFLGEWFLDTTLGVPYYQIIFKKNVTDSTILSVYKKAIETCAGIVSVDKLTITDDTTAQRTKLLTFEVQTQDGDIIEFNDFRLEGF